MASAPELPLPLYLERSSSFCNSVKNDLDYFIGEVGYLLMTVNRTAKTAPQQRHKNRQFPGSCTLELKEFATTKKNVLNKLQTSFETMEQKWSNEISEFKGWFLENIATYLSKVQLDLKVSGRYSNLVAGNPGPSSFSEVERMPFDQLPDSASASGHNTNSYSQGVAPSCVPASAGDVDSTVFQEKGKRTGGPVQMNSKAKSTGPSKTEFSTDTSIPHSGIGEQGLGSGRLISQGSNMLHALGHPINSASAPPGVIGGNDFQEDANSFCSSSSPVNVSKVGTKVGGRSQTKRSAYLSKGEIVAIPESHIERAATRSRVSDANMSIASVPCSVTGTDNFQEDTDSFFTASPHPSPVNAKKVGKGGKVSKSKMEKDAKAILLTNGKCASDTDEPSVNSKVSETNMCCASVPSSAVGANSDFQENADSSCTVRPPPVNPDKRSEVDTDDRCQVEKGAKSVQLIKDKGAPTDSCIEELSVSGKVSDSDVSHASIQPGTVDINDSRGNVDYFRTSSSPFVHWKKRNRKEAGDRDHVKNGANAMQLTNEVATVHDLGIEESAIGTKVLDTSLSCAPVQLGSSDSKDFHENGILSHTASPPLPVNAITMGNKRTGGRGQVKKGAMAIQLTKEKSVTDFTTADSAVEKPALRSNSAASPPPVKSGTCTEKQSLGRCEAVSPSPPVNDDKTGKKRACGRGQIKKGTMAVQPTKEESATDSGTEKQDLGSCEAVSPPPPVNDDKTGKNSTKACGGEQMKKGTMAVQPTKEESATDSGTEKQALESCEAVSPPPVNDDKTGKKEACGRGQKKKGTMAVQPTKEESATDSGTEKQDLESCEAVSPPPPVNDDKTGKKGACGRGQMKKGTMAVQPTKEESATDSGTEKQALESCEAVSPPPPVNDDKTGKKGACGGEQTKKGEMAVQPTKEESATDSGTEKQALESCEAVSPPPPVNDDKSGKKRARGRGQTKKGTMAVQPTKEESATDSGTEKQALESCEAVSPPPVNDDKTGKKGACGRGQMKKGTMAVQPTKEESATDSGTEKQALESCEAVSPPPVNDDKPGKKRARGRGQTKKVTMAVELTKEESATDSGTEKQDLESCEAVSPPPPVSDNKTGEKRAGGRGQAKKGTMAVELTKEENATDFAIEKPALRSGNAASLPPVNADKTGKKSAGGRGQMKKGTMAVQPTKEESATDSGTEKQALESCEAVSPPPVNDDKPGKKRARGRGQTKKGTMAVQPTKEESATDSGTEKQDLESCEAVSPPPPVNDNKSGEKRAGGRGQAKKVTMAVELTKEENATDFAIEKPALRSGNAASLPPVNADKTGKKSAGGRGQMKKGTMAVEPTKERCPPPINADKLVEKRTCSRNQVKKGAGAIQLHLTKGRSATDCGIEKPAVRSNGAASPPPPVNTDTTGKKRTCGRVQAKKGERPIQLTEERSAADSGTEMGAVGSNHATSPAVVNSVKNDKEKTGGRRQAKRGAGVIPLTEEKSECDCTSTGSAFEKPAVRGSNTSCPHTNTKEFCKKRLRFLDMEGSGAPCALGSHSDVSSSVFQENVGSFHSASAPPPANTKRVDRKGAGRAQVKNRSKPVQLSNNETATAMNIPNSDIVEPVLRGKMSDWQGLLTAVENAPCKPGLFEVKVWRAKNPAYIGHSGDLQQSVSQYREGKPSGEKQLDQFIQRNKDEISVRYETYPSLQSAKQQQKKKLKEFMEKHKKLPSYNYGL